MGKVGWQGGHSEGTILAARGTRWAPQTQPLPTQSLAPRKPEEEEEELEETAQEKKLRLAKLYLEQLRQQGEPVGRLAMGRACACAVLLPSAATPAT